MSDVGGCARAQRRASQREGERDLWGSGPRIDTDARPKIRARIYPRRRPLVRLYMYLYIYIRMCIYIAYSKYLRPRYISRPMCTLYALSGVVHALEWRTATRQTTVVHITALSRINAQRSNDRKKSNGRIEELTGERVFFFQEKLKNFDDGNNSHCCLIIIYLTETSMQIFV